MNRTPKDYDNGLYALGIPSDDSLNISKYLKQGELPGNVIDAVIENEAEVEKLHPDKFPWGAQVFDTLSQGFVDQGIDAKAVWDSSKRYVRMKYDRDMPVNCNVDDPSDALAVFLQMYALAKYHDIGKLAVTRMP